MIDYLILLVAAFAAGLIDAVVGGGGLINVPTLFSVYPTAAPASLLATNKLAGIWGTGAAAWNYSRTVKLNWRVALPAALAAFIFALLGAFTVTLFSPQYLRQALPFILVLLLIYIFKKKQLGQHHQPLLSGWREWVFALATGMVIGFYDGFFGPGTGSFLIFIFVRFFGFDFLHASAASKVVNVASNAAALIMFGLPGILIWKVGIGMAVCGVVGSMLGSRLAIKNGSQFVRRLFLCIVSALIIKTFYDAFLR